MKKQILFGVLLLAALATAKATLFYEGTPGNGVVTTGITSTGVGTFNPTITDGSTVGTWNQISVSGLGSSLTDIRVTLNVSGGNNSDLYAYLSYGGQSVVLLNRIGVSGSTPFGNTGSSLNVTLDSTSGNIHNTAGSGNISSGSYSADGQTISPLSSAGSFSSSGGSITLDAVFGTGSVDPNGTWTLFLADVVSGGGNETLNGWSLDITAVPEPVRLSLGVFAAMLLALAGLKWTWRRGFWRG